MRKQEIIDYNRINIEKLSDEDRGIILNDYTETEPYYYKGNLNLCGYKRMPGGEYVRVPYKYTRYTCTVLASDGNMWQFGFSNRSRLRNIIKKIQSINDNIIAKVIAIQEVQMNSNELNKAVMKIVQREIEPMVTEYMQQHPEYFHPTVSGTGFICSHNITLSFQPRTLSDVASVKPTIFIELGYLDRGHKLACFDHHPEDLMSTFVIDGSWVTEQEMPNV